MSDRGQLNSKRLLANKPGANELGQMSIFLALVFQVLFVFFAMVINIGLLVHDKINLQNSVDLGAYYAAQKQAEILNEIAHLNYQIRQDYKLLAWRYWVLGTIGRNGGSGLTQLPPQVSAFGTDPGEIPRLYRSGANPGGPLPPAQEEVPVACLANPYWWEFAILSHGAARPNENYCWHPYNWVSGQIAMPSLPSTPATAAINRFATALAAASRADYRLSCAQASPLSWAFVAAIMTNYKYSISYKKRAIKRLTENLVSENPLDRDGVPIRQGVIATIEKNLTESNRAGFDPNQVQILNGLTKGGCNEGSRPGERTLPEILTAPGMYFSLLGILGNSCNFSIRFQLDHDSIRVAGGNIALWDPAPPATLRQMVSGEPNFNDDFHSSLGFEKNPWCMAYVGVKTTTRSRKPFAPFGQPTTLEARAFAQPFGGRIGPWYGKRWERLAQISNSPPAPAAAPGSSAMNPHPSQIAERTDPLTSPRLVPSGNPYQYSAFTIPNFSRFPGDPLGFRSRRAQAVARHYFLPVAAISTSRPAGGPEDPRLRLNWFYGFGSFPNSGDSLAFDMVAAATAGAMPAPLQWFRKVEMAAVAPDLFDLTYYSVDPAADENYVNHARNNPGRYGATTQRPVGDLGSREDVADMRASDVETQIAAVTAGNPGESGVDPSLRGVVFWLVRSWKHLLTGWAPHRVTTFTFPTARFGQCQPGGEAIAGVMIPGKCTVGGRVGYSVRLVSRDHLNGPWQVGGNGVSAQPILNPPGDDSQF